MMPWRDVPPFSYSHTHTYTRCSTHDDYPLDECLRVCQQASSPSASLQLLDATAFLLERTGDVQGALQLLTTAIDARALDALLSVLQRLDAREFAAFVASVQGGEGTGGGKGNNNLTPAVLRRKGLVRKVRRRRGVGVGIEGWMHECLPRD